MSGFKVHNFRYYDLKPKAGHCLAYSQSRRCLAVSREDNSIEIWNFTVHNTPVLERCIPAQATEGSVEAISWAGEKPHRPEDDDSDQGEARTSPQKPQSQKGGWRKNKAVCEDRRLFSTGLHGVVIEHDLDYVDDPGEARKAKQGIWAVTSGAAWCMKFNAECGKLAVGTEEGYVSLFDVVGDGLQFDKVLDKQEGRVLCLDWHVSGNYLATGSTDTVRTWDANSGHPLMKMSTGRTMKHVETTVWAVVVLDNMTVVSGDSRGKTSFWNGRTGTLMDAYQSHKADVLSVAVNRDQNAVFSAGVDPLMMIFQPVARGKLDKHFPTRNQAMEGPAPNPRWIKAGHRFSHSHDVRAILAFYTKIVSVGVDSHLTVCDLKDKSVTKHPPVPHGNNAILSPDAEMLSLKYPDAVEVWKLGKGQSVAADFKHRVVPLIQQPRKLLSLKASENSTIAEFCVASDASFVGFVTTDGKLRVFHLEFDEESRPTSVRKVPFETVRNLSRFNNVQFYEANGGCNLLASTVGGTLVSFSLKTVIAEMWSASIHDLKLKSGIRMMAVGGGNCLIVDVASNVSAIDLKAASGGKIEAKTLPTQRRVPVTACAFDSRDDSKVVIVYANHKFVEYSLEDEAVTKFSRLCADEEVCPLPSDYLTKKYPTTGIAFPTKDSLMFSDVENVCTVRKSKVLNNSKLDSKSKAKSKKTGSGRESELLGGEEVMKVTQKYQNLIHLADLGRGDELVVVEVKPQEIEAKLPPSMRKKKFGAM